MLILAIPKPKIDRTISVAVQSIQPSLLINSDSTIPKPFNQRVVSVGVIHTFTPMEYNLTIPPSFLLRH